MAIGGINIGGGGGGSSSKDLNTENIYITTDTDLISSQLGKPIIVESVSDIIITLPAGQTNAVALLKNKGTGLVKLKAKFVNTTPTIANLTAKYKLDSDMNDCVGTNNASITGTITYSPGSIDNGAYFNGSSYGTINRPITDDFTIYFRFKSTQVRDAGNTQWWSGAGLINSEVGGYVDDFGCSLNGDGRILFGANGACGYTGTGFNDGQWHTVCWRRTKSTGTMTVTMDGTILTTLTGCPTTSLTAASVTRIGTGGDTSKYFTGMMDDIWIFDRVITDTEMAQLNAEEAEGTQKIESSTELDINSGDSVILIWNTSLKKWLIFENVKTITNTSNFNTSKIAAVALNAYMVVCINSLGKIQYADISDTATITRVVGITDESALIDAQVSITTCGEITNPAWNFDITKPVYLSSAGNITQSPADTGAILQVGIPMANTTLFVDVKMPIIQV